MAWVKDDWGRLARALGGVGAGYLGQREKERAHGLREREVTSAEERAAAYIEALNQQTEAGRFRQKQDIEAATYLRRPVGEAFADPSQVPVGRMGELQQYQTGQRAGEQFGWQQELAAHETQQRERAQSPIGMGAREIFATEGIPEELLGKLTEEEFSQFLPYIAQRGAEARQGALGGEAGPGFEPAMGRFQLQLEGDMRERALNELIVQDMSQGGTLIEDLKRARDSITGEMDWDMVAQSLGPERWYALSNMSRQMTDQWLMDQIGFEGEGAPPEGQQAPGPEAETVGGSEIIQGLEARIAELEAEKKKPLPTDEQLRDWYLRQHPAVGTPQPGMAPEMGALAQDPAAMLTLARSEWEQQPAGAGFAVLGRPGEQRARATQQKAKKVKQTQAQKLRQAALKKKRVGVRAGGRAGIAAGGRPY